MTITFRGTTALITGASAGLGTEFADQFARRGADVVLVARRADRLEEIAAEVRSRHGVSAHVVPLDLTEPGAVATLADELEGRGIRVDHVVNNAGFGMKGAFAEADAERIDALVQLNVAVLTSLTRAFLPALVARGSGTVINIASTAAFQPLASMAIYGASKAYVLSFTEALAHEVRPQGVTVLAVCPGATATEFFDVVGDARAAVGAMQTPTQVVDAAFRALARRKPPYSVVSGVQNKTGAVIVGLVPRRARVALTAGLLER
ncbi:MAG: oxidoreductase [Microbacterium sp. SCN 71-21]|jgi:uncharacterized protein|uniref:SDR family NAD(P)-dependent oxidoreductase n=1 Tax=Microbacterium sp. SCN 71-21 TaxID=1660116 RepID=UPI00086C2240|nr:SDR family oxidoreductase [Microbacterium sp. SCN 71-21]ODU79423.1 MAG: oxidoreductase [Microbacterium sp. SCN 71-21]